MKANTVTPKTAWNFIKFLKRNIQKPKNLIEWLIEKVESVDDDKEYYDNYVNYGHYYHLCREILPSVGAFCNSLCYMSYIVLIMF